MNAQQTCIACGVSFEIINEEATGEHTQCPPELRCCDCQVAYRLKSPQYKQRETSWITYIYNCRQEFSRKMIKIPHSVSNNEAWEQEYRKNLREIYT